MFSHVLLLGILGMCCGILTGLMPGIHVNTASPLAASMVSYAGIDVLAASSFICAMSVTHTFIDFIPATLLGVPEAETALAVLPAHKMVLSGRGFEAIRLSGIASLFSVITILILLPIIILMINTLYPLITKTIPLLLIIFSIITINANKTINTKLWAIVIFFISGCYGCVVLFNPWISPDPLFPIFSGFFGISTLILSMKSSTSIPVQNPDGTILMGRRAIFSSCLKGSLAGMLVATIPGVGASQATIVSNVASSNEEGIGERQFIATCCSINTANAIFALIVLYLFGKARNGALLHVQSLLDTLSKSEFSILFAIMLCASGLSFVVLLQLSQILLKRISSIKYSVVTLVGVGVQLIIIAILSGPTGLLLCTIAFCIGIMPPLLNVNRTTLMAFLLMPVLLTYL